MQGKGEAWLASFKERLTSCYQSATPKCVATAKEGTDNEVQEDKKRVNKRANSTSVSKKSQHQSTDAAERKAKRKIVLQKKEAERTAVKMKVMAKEITNLKAQIKKANETTKQQRKKLKLRDAAISSLRLQVEARAQDRGKGLIKPAEKTAGENDKAKNRAWEEDPSLLPEQLRRPHYIWGASN